MELELNRQNLSASELVITEPTVDLNYYRTVYKTPNANGYKQGVVKFNRMSLASERLLNAFTGDRLMQLAGGIGIKSIMPDGLREKAKMIVCTLIDQQLNDDFVLNEGRTSRDYSGGGISYSEAQNAFSNPYDMTFEGVRLQIRSSGLMEYLQALEIGQGEAGVIFNQDAYVKTADYASGSVYQGGNGSYGTALQYDNSEVRTAIDLLEGVGLPDNVSGDGTTKDSLNFILDIIERNGSQNKVDGLEDVDETIITTLEPNTFIINDDKNIDIDLGTIGEFGDGTLTTTQDKAINKASDLPIDPITGARLIIDATNVQEALEELDAKTVSNADLIFENAGAIDINEAAIVSNRTDIDINAGNITTNADNILAIENKISTEIEPEIDANTLKNDQQDTRLSAIESLIVQNQSDDGVFASPNGSILVTRTNIATITEETPFDDIDSVELVGNQFVIKRNLNLTINLTSTLQLVSNDTQVVTAWAQNDLGDLGTSITDVAEASQEFSFRNNSNLNNQSIPLLVKARNIDQEDPSTWWYITLSIKSQDQVITTSNVKHQVGYVVQEQATGEIVNFEGLTNDTDVAGVNGKEVINNLNADKADKTELDEKVDKTKTISDDSYENILDWKLANNSFVIQGDKPSGSYARGRIFTADGADSATGIEFGNSKIYKTTNPDYITNPNSDWTTTEIATVEDFISKTFSDLETTDKTIVGGINEINAKSGGGGATNFEGLDNDTDLFGDNGKEVIESLDNKKLSKTTNLPDGSNLAAKTQSSNFVWEYLDNGLTGTGVELKFEKIDDSTRKISYLELSDYGETEAPKLPVYDDEIVIKKYVDGGTRNLINTLVEVLELNTEQKQKLMSVIPEKKEVK